MKIKWDMSGAKKLERELRGGDNMNGLLEDIATVYTEYLRRRYVRQSEGGGDWPGLAPSTLANKRRGTEGVKILRHFGLLLNALATGAPGNYRELGGENKITFGFAATPHSAGVTYRDLATWHDSGAGHLPQRRILALPDEPTARTFTKLMQRFIQKSTETRT